MTIPAAELNRRLTLLKLSDSDDGGGGEHREWVLYMVVWAQLTPQQGNDTYFAEQLDDRIAYNAVVRYQKGIVPNMRATYKGRTFVLRSVIDPGELHEELSLRLEELQATGVTQ